MTFPSILPHLAAGRRVRRKGWYRPTACLGDEIPNTDCETLQADVADLLSSDWELADEPTPDPRDATITRLTRELEISRAVVRDLREGRRIHSLTLRLDDGTEVAAQLTAIKARP